ncbi:DUF2520 domain-containing protein [Galbibacter sp. EGI 63066]|uniref:Rossmann-like and DUF2520 domain-containing protein n=1 Tax=Galbibacter sp. EGI 63066 TaxID=2993559 RepID=UPI0022493A66|nr:DUF2520 domain-containing protein [Galbibacter sp. EGI 63066]MCX2679321.1 DUF2520 domain-containing protein [Galbibacter sp. EGI 63066]
MLNTVLLGGGNIAHHLFVVIRELTSVNLIQCYNRNIEAIKSFEKHLEITDDLNKLKDADLYIIAVSDNAIAEVSATLPFSDRLVVHTSGSMPMNELAEKNRRGVFYPLQTFSKEKPVDFSEIPICLEAENQKDLNTLKTLANALSDKVYEMNSHQRKTLHIAAVFVNNFVNHLYYIGNDLCEKDKIPFEILHPLIKETSEKLMKVNPKEAQTGPAIRNDIKTINSHLDQIENNAYKDIYKILTASIINTYGREEL